MSTTSNTNAIKQDAEAPPGLIATLSGDRMKVLVSCLAGELPDGASEVLRAQLEKLGINDEFAQVAACVRLGQAVNDDVPIDELCVLEGTPATPPVDGVVAWEREFFKPGFITDPRTDKVDYRQRAADPVVRAGQLLATLRLPDPGAPGRDLLGNAVPPRAPRTAQLRAGRGVRAEAEARMFYADADGRVRLSGGVLVVDNECNVTGSVCLKTGNLNHPGSVHVHGDIESGMRLEAEGEITVDGTIEDAVVVSGGDIHVRGGITGGKHCRISAAGGVHARFIENAAIYAEGDVESGREIQHCTIRTRGAIRACTGHILGSEIVALGGIEVLEAGTETGAPVSLTAGLDYTLAERANARRAEANALEARIRQVHEKIDPIFGHEDHMSTKARDSLKLLAQNVHEMEAALSEIQTAIQEMERESQERRRAEITVLQTAWPGTTFHIDDVSLSVTTYLQGPARIVPGEGELQIEAVTRQP